MRQRKRTTFIKRGQLHTPCIAIAVTQNCLFVCAHERRLVVEKRIVLNLENTKKVISQNVDTWEKFNSRSVLETRARVHTTHLSISASDTYR